MRDKDDEKHRIMCESDLAKFGPVPKLKGEIERHDKNDVLTVQSCA